MNQLKFYKYAALGLFVLNVSFVSFFFLTKPKLPPMPHQKGERGKVSAVDILKLDEQQHEKFKVLAKEHHEAVGRINVQQKAILEDYFSRLVDESIELNINVGLKGLTQLEERKVDLTYQHFKEIKMLLRSEQLVGFELFMNDVLKILLTASKRPPRPDMNH